MVDIIRWVLPIKSGDFPELTVKSPDKNNFLEAIGVEIWGPKVSNWAHGPMSKQDSQWAL